MTKSLATASLALLALFGSVAPAAAASKAPEKGSRVEIVKTSDSLFDIEYWGVIARHADSRIVAQSGDGEI